MYDAIIIGAGAAGMSAALWCDDLGLHHVVLERGTEIGGQLLWINNSIANHLGTPHAANGSEMRDLFAAQIAARPIDIRTGTDVSRLHAAEQRVVLTSGETLDAHALVIATGLRRRTLGIPGEAEFRNRGVATSGTGERDALSGCTVCVVGGGDAAVENALLLAEVCPRVRLISRGTRLRARPEFVERLTREPRITHLPETQITRIYGGASVEGVELRRAGAIEHLATDAVLVRIGYEPNTELLRGQVETDDAGYIRVTHEHETSAPNVFAIGDISNPHAPTISGAIGAGATVAKVINARARRNLS